jgi:protein tyrosine phosphatase (PTP) superfamily phosphohydrolase (DUF442 family)
MTRRMILFGILLGTLLGSTGCRHFCRRGVCSSRNDLPPRARDELLIPPPTGGLPSARALPSDGGLPPPTVNSDPSGSRYRPQRETLFPDPLLEAPSIGGQKANEPPPILTIPEGTSSNRSEKSAVPAGLPSPGPAPTGLPGHAVVRDRIATGRKPTIEGFDSLRGTGFKTVVYLHSEGRDVTATRELAEKKGLAFVAIPVDPNIMKTASGAFAETVGDSGKQPMYVFDDDGVRTGSLWYLYFRTVDSMADDAAQVKAAALGLRDARGDEKTNFWLAIQDLLAKR